MKGLPVTGYEHAVRASAIMETVERERGLLTEEADAAIREANGHALAALALNSRLLDPRARPS
jgi:hypothetical protein